MTAGMIINGIVYYLILIVATYMYIAKRPKRQLTICDMIIASSWVLCAFGGWLCSYGYVLREIQQFRLSVYMCYVLFVVLTVIAFNAGRRTRIKLVESVCLDVRIANKGIWILFIIILVYAIAFFSYIWGNIPLINLLAGSSVSDATVSRLQVTHNITDSYELPYVFRFRKLLTETPLYFLLSLCFLRVLSKKRGLFLFLLVFVTTVFCHSFALEKSGIVNIMVLLAFNYAIYLGYKNIRLSRKNKKKLFYIALSVIGLIIAMYWFFMGQDNLATILESIYNRLCLKQTGYIYYHDIVLEQNYNGCLYGKEVPIFLLDGFLGREPVSLSGEIYNLVYKGYSGLGLTGTTGTMPMFFLYSNFGFILGSIMYFILACITAGIDSTLLRKTQSAENKELSIAVYSTLMLLFYQAFISNLSTVYMLPFIIAPGVIVLLLCVWFVKKISGY